MSMMSKHRQEAPQSNQQRSALPQEDQHRLKQTEMSKKGIYEKIEQEFDTVHKTTLIQNTWEEAEKVSKERKWTAGS